MTKSELLRTQFKGLLWLIECGSPAEILYAARRRRLLDGETELQAPSAIEFEAEDVEVVGRFYNKVEATLHSMSTLPVHCGKIYEWLHSCKPDIQQEFLRGFNTELIT